MASRAVGALSVDHVPFWNRFQSLAERRVEEGNTIAGERLWKIVASREEAARLIVQSTSHADDFVACSFDPKTGILTCSCGAAIQSGSLTFHLLESAAGQLLREEGECTLDQALALILDKLTWRDDGDDPRERAPEVEAK